jgi:hypothetical protein
VLGMLRTATTRRWPLHGGAAQRRRRVKSMLACNSVRWLLTSSWAGASSATCTICCAGSARVACGCRRFAAYRRVMTLSAGRRDLGSLALKSLSLR